jgi:Dolichyl-phosphate-mannose-protein mannosyltransferase
MLIGAFVYLVNFVPRGWIPHDEGMLGQSAERVLNGGVPHIDYEEAYTGGLSWIYAALFRVSGVDLLNVRWFLFGGAAFAIWLTYAVLRRYLQPIAAALGAWVALAWSFPNYFAGLPSWWLLVCALVCLWSVVRHVETGDWRHIAAAGLSAGLAIAIKQTGIYLLLALLLFLMYDGKLGGRPSAPHINVERHLRWGIAIVAIAVAAVILAPRMFAAEGIYLFVPAAACAMVVLLRSLRGFLSASRISPIVGIMIAGTAALVPFAVLLFPYVVHGRVGDFIYGAFVLPRKRLTFASVPMASVAVIVTGIPMMGLVLPVPRSMFGSRSRFIEALMWAAAVLLPIAALSSAGAYQFIWQSTRAFASMLPVAICWRLATDRVQDHKEQRILFISAAMLAWAALNQFPYAGGIYFCYVAPLAVIAGAALGSTSSSLRPHTILPWTLMVLLFAVLSPHRAYVQTLGLFHRPRVFDTALDLPRARLTLNRADVEVYRRVVAAVKSHSQDGPLIAGPDCPEIYFLAGVNNPSPRLFEFFSDAPGASADELSFWSKGEVIVVNRMPEFSPKPTSALFALLRAEFPHGEQIGKFEVRWR